MAQRVVLIDDLDGDPAAESVMFSVDGSHYEIDLTADHAAELRSAFQIWVAAARRVGGRRVRHVPVPAPSPAGAADNATIRAWATENGYQVSARGRIPERVLEAFRTAVTG